MTKEELQPFYDAAIAKHIATLPTEKLKMEEHLFEFQVNYTHLAELMWSKYSGKKTDNYLQYLLEICLEHLMIACGLAGISLDDFLVEFNDYTEQLSPITSKNYDDLIVATIVYQDKNNEVDLRDPIFRTAVMFKAFALSLNVGPIQLFEHYQTWQKAK